MLSCIFETYFLQVLPLVLFHTLTSNIYFKGIILKLDILLEISTVNRSLWIKERCAWISSFEKIFKLLDRQLLSFFATVSRLVLLKQIEKGRFTGNKSWGRAKFT